MTEERLKHPLSRGDWGNSKTSVHRLPKGHVRLADVALWLENSPTRRKVEVTSREAAPSRSTHIVEGRWFNALDDVHSPDLRVTTTPLWWRSVVALLVTKRIICLPLVSRNPPMDGHSQQC